MRALPFLALGAILVASIVVLTQDPEQAWAVAVVIIALGLAAGAVAIAAQLRWAPSARRRSPRRGIALRRGAEVAAVVALLLWLRAIDGLSILTAAFVIAAFFVAEAMLSAQPRSSR